MQCAGKKFFYILQGIPGIGKSTWISNHGLTAFTICPNTERLELSRWETYDTQLKESISNKQIAMKTINGERFVLIPTYTDKGCFVFVQDIYGNIGIDQSFSRKVFDIIVPKKINEAISEGWENIVLDATNTKASEFSKYACQANTNGYEVIVVQFPIDTDKAKVQNKVREYWKRVPDEVIDRMANQLRNFQKPLDAFIKYSASDEI